MEHSSANTSVQVAGTSIRKITYDGQQVVSLAMIDLVHARVQGTARRTFNENRSRFTEGDDYLILNQPDEIRSLGFTRPQGGTPALVVLITRRGYLKIVKSLNDDMAWAVFDDMIERYFAIEHGKPVTIDDLIANPHQLLSIAQGYALQVEELKREKSVMEADVKVLGLIAGSDDLFGVRVTAKLLQIPEKKFVDALRARRWAFRQTGTNTLLCYAEKDRAGLCRNVANTYNKNDGTIGVRETLKFTMSGVVALAKMLNPPVLPQIQKRIDV